MRTEGSCPVVVLAVNVVGERPAHRDPPGTRHYRQEPALRHCEGEDIGQRDPGLTAQHAGDFVERDQAIEAGRVEEQAAVVETAVPVAAATGEGEYGLFHQ